MIMSGRKGWPETGARHGSGEMIDSLPNDSRFNVWRRPEMLPVGPRYTVGRDFVRRVADVARRILWAVPRVAAIF